MLPPEPQFATLFLKKKPVHCEFGHDGVSETTGLAFDDITRMSTATHTSTRHRRDERPLWFCSSDKTARVLTELWELRAYGIRIYAEHDKYPNLTLRQRLDKAQEYLVSVILPSHLVHLDRLCKEWKNCIETDKRKAIAEHIRTIDTHCRVIKSGSGLILRIWYLAWNLGLHSVAISEIVGYGSPFIRQCLFRARICAQQCLEGDQGQERYHVRKVNRAKRKLKRTEDRLAILLAGKEAFIAAAVAKAARRFVSREAAAAAAVRKAKASLVRDPSKLHSMPGELNPFFGHHHSEESKQKISETKKAQQWQPSEEWIAAQRARTGENSSYFGRTHSEQTRNRMRAGWARRRELGLKNNLSPERRECLRQQAARMRERKAALAG